MGADGSSQTNVTNHPAFDLNPAWSPDGTRIAFTSDRDGNYEIYTMNVDGSNQTNVTNNAADDFFPTWSADGSTIAFSSNRGGDFDVYTMNSDGSNPTNITNDPADDFTGDWSPDGTRIAFASERDGDLEIYTMGADGSDVTKATDSPAEDLYPAWAPDGTKIAFASFRDGDYEIYVMNPDGSAQVNLTNELAGGDFDPDWQAISGPVLEPCDVKVTDHGWIVPEGGGRGVFRGHGSASADGSAAGDQQYVDRRARVRFRSRAVDAIECSPDRTRVSIVGSGHVSRTPVDFRIELQDLGHPGRGIDTYRIAFSDGFDSGEHVIAAGDIRIR
jgi:hypothetical protein